VSLFSRFVRFGFVAIFFAPIYTNATTFVPISVGDITIIIPINDAPVANDDVLTVDEDTPINVPILANDEDESLATINAMCSQSVTSNCVTFNNLIPNTGTIALSSGVASFQLPEHWNGTASFTYQLFDENEQASNEATVTVTVNPVNDAPVAVGEALNTSDSYSVTIGQPTVLNVTFNDFDPDGDNITIVFPESFHSDLLAVVTPDGKSLEVTATSDVTSSVGYFVQDALGARSQRVFAGVRSFSSSDTFPIPQNITLTVARTSVCNENMSNRLSDRIANGCVFTIDSLQNVSDPDSTLEQLRLDDVQNENGDQLHHIKADGTVHLGPEFGELETEGNNIIFIPNKEFYEQLIVAPQNAIEVFRYVIEDQFSGVGHALLSIVGNVVANSPPQITSFSPQSGTQFLTTDRVVVMVEATDDTSGLTVRFRFDGGGWRDVTSAPYSTSYGRVSRGSHRIEVVAVDAAGVESTPVILDIQVSTETSNNNFSASPSSVRVGQALTLTWDVAGASSCSLSQGTNVLRSNLPGASTNYGLTLYSAGNGLTLNCVDSGGASMPAMSAALTVQRLSAPTLNQPVVQ
jgi:hypothetical protein